MTIKINQLREQLQASLASHRRNPSDASIAATALSLARAGIDEMKKQPTQHSSKNKRERNPPVRMLMPFFLSSNHYLTKVCRTLDIKIFYGRQIFRDFLVQELSDVTKFLTYHLQYTQYSSIDPVELPTPLENNPSLSAATKSNTAPPIEELAPASIFHSPYLRVHLDYKEFLEFETKELNASAVSATGNVFEFTGTQADAMEQIQGWTAKKIIVVNGKPANLRQVAEMWEAWFRMAIPNVYNKKRVNQSRKKGKTPFLNSMVTLLQEESSRTKPKRV
ncbi:MAG: RteC domain-containing protein [Puia sp.]|nr:RteC domain-containing protein [Puia sp.]